MFASFFPKPKLFLWSGIAWSALCIVMWYAGVGDLGPSLSLGGVFGYGYPGELPPGADDAQKALFAAAADSASTVWVYQYMILCMAAFAAFWAWAAPHRWYWWSVVVSAVIIFITWFQVQLDVLINNWFGRFYDLIQRALAKPGNVTLEEYYGELITFITIALIYITVTVFSLFIVSHYIFRWRTAMNEYYTENWLKLRQIEGASQRVQEDTMRFATIMEDLGVKFIESFMTLIAFIPILWALSAYVKVLPVVGEVQQALVFVAIIWSVFGTGLMAIAGIRLPGLQFRNQRVEAAYRKELVLGEDDVKRAQPPTLGELFANVRANYFRLYYHYLYFNVVRYSYLQSSVLVAYVALGPTIVAAGFTLGIMQQIVRAFGQVQSSFQFLVTSWTTIVELISIYKRLQAFEAILHSEPLSDIELEAATPPAIAP